MFTLPDLFLVGTAFDLVGGYLIARGLLISLPVMAIRCGSFWGGNPAVGAAAVEDRADAAIGLVILGLGFVLQGTGYFVEIASEPSSKPSAGRALAALGLAAAAAAMVLLVWRIVRQRLIRRDLILLARYRVENNQQPPVLDELPDLLDLAGYAIAWRGPVGAETPPQTVARVFGPETMTRSATWAEDDRHVRRE